MTPLHSHKLYYIQLQTPVTGVRCTLRNCHAGRHLFIRSSSPMLLGDCTSTAKRHALYRVRSVPAGALPYEHQLFIVTAHHSMRVGNGWYKANQNAKAGLSSIDNRIQLADAGVFERWSVDAYESGLYRLEEWEQAAIRSVGSHITGMYPQRSV